MRKVLSIVPFLLIMLTQVYSQDVSPNYEDGKLYVKLKTNLVSNSSQPVTIAEKYELNDLPFFTPLSDAYEITAFGRAFKGNANAQLNSTMVLEFNNIAMVEQIIGVLKKDPAVEYVEKIPLNTRHFTPNDPELATQWHLNTINAKAAWDYVNPASKIVIAVVDDAIERLHPDLAPNIWVNPKEISGNGLDDDNNGYVDDINGWDVVNNSQIVDPPTSDYAHGTHVAGIASAATNNGIGISSMGYNCKIMCVKATGTSANSITGGYSGILYAANNGANVINMSWGSSSYSLTNQSVIDYAISKGCILVASAGNNNTSAENYPGAYNGVVSVASTTITDARSSFSTYGAWVKISAPGSSIYSTIIGGTYGNNSGTSMASPLVAGLVGLMKTLNPGMPNAELLNCLYNTADNILQQNPSLPGQLGAGRINAAKAMECVAATLNRAPVAEFAASVTTVTQGGAVVFTDQSSYTPTSWQWSFTGGTPSVFTGKTPPAIVYNTPGQFSVTLTVTSGNGSNSKTRTAYITVNDPPSCVTINQPTPSGWSPINYVSGLNALNGHVNGMNSILDKEKAMYFDLSASNYQGIVSTIVRFGRAASANPAKKVPVRFYDGTTGVPGAQIGVTELTMEKIISDVKAAKNTVVDLSASVLIPASRKFFISIDASNLEWSPTVKDTLSIVSNLNGQTATALIWDKKADNVWRNYGTAGTWDFGQQSLYIFPQLTSKPASVVLSPKNAVVCAGTAVEFNGTGSVYSDLLTWQMPAANAPTTVTNQLKVTPVFAGTGSFKIYLTARGGCSESRTDSTLITINPSPTVNIAASKNPICAGETATLTASGSGNYTWSPATGLSAATGSTILANPATTTNYTISSTSGGCQTSIPFELTVRPRNTNVTISASETQITAPTQVTFSASASNGGSNPVYDFFVNNISVQRGSNSILVRTVSPGNGVKCELTSNEPCVDEKTVTSEVLTMGVTTVPVSLLRFSGSRISKANRLVWTTVTEKNTKTFVVESSSNAQQFTKIGEVGANGNSNSMINYAFEDADPKSGKTYYRLKIVDTDGKYAYSNIILLEYGQQKMYVTLYPNPSKSGSTAFISISGSQKGMHEVTISNTVGQVLKSFTVNNINNDNTTLQLPARGLASGVYIISVTDATGTGRTTQQWIIR